MQTFCTQSAVVEAIRDRRLEPADDAPVIAICSECRDAITADQIYYDIDGLILCEECLEQYRRDCFHKDFRNIPEIFCEECLSNLYGDSFYVINGEIYCEECIKNYRICP